MIVIAILGIIGSIGSRLFFGVTKFYRLNSARTEIQRELRVILDNMNRKIRQASAKTVNISQNTDQPPYSRLTFNTLEGETIIYEQNGKTLTEIVGERRMKLTDNVKYITFTYPETDINTVMSISITLTKATYSGGEAALQMAITKVRIMNP